MYDYGEIRTQFLSDRLKANRWRKRKYIRDLIDLERFVAKGGPKSTAGGYWFHGVKNRYPLEVWAITQELWRGKTVSPDEFKARQKERQRIEREYEKDQRKERRRIAAATPRWDREDAKRERRQWLELGGKG